MPQKDKQACTICGKVKKNMAEHMRICHAEAQPSAPVTESASAALPAPAAGATSPPVPLAPAQPLQIDLYPKDLKRLYKIAEKKGNFSFFNKSVDKYNLKHKTDFQKASAPAPTLPGARPPASERTRVIKVRNISWWKLLLGAGLLAVGIFGIILYAGNMNMFMGMLAIVGLVPGVFLVYYGFKSKKESGYQYVRGNKPQYTGRENTIVITAVWDEKEKRAIPEDIDFDEWPEEMLPKSAHMHLLRNNGKHYFEIYNIINENGEMVDEKGNRIYEAVTMPDKKLITPEAFVIPSNMQPYKDYMEYNPPSAFQKIASGVLIIAMIVIGILMTMTTSKTPEQKAQMTKTSAYQLPAMERQYDIVWQ